MIGSLQCVVLDCPDVLEPARFYEALLGGVVDQPDPRWAVGDDFSTLHTGSGLVRATPSAFFEADGCLGGMRVPMLC
ncbi:VOC family protein [Streptacidiphilus jeojiensis]|uniref:VOC family protein n=1 Tax=Streptacidiphilus jeojiensis TaxID=3229225 RepID=UPI0036D39217